MKKPSLFLLIILLSFTTCKKEEKKEEKEIPSGKFDYAFTAGNIRLHSFPLLCSSYLDIKLLSGTAQEVKVKVIVPETVKCWIKDSVMLAGTRKEVMFSLNKPLPAGEFTYTVETSSPGTETRVFTGRVIRPKESCTALYAGEFDVKEECRESLESDVTISYYKVLLRPDPVVDNILVVENFKGRPDWTAELALQCNPASGGRSSDPDSRPKFTYYRANFTDSLSSSSGRMEPSQLTGYYTIIWKGERNTCYATYTR